MRTDYGFDLPRNVQIEFSKIVQARTDETGAELTSTELWTAFEHEYLAPAGPFGFLEAHATDSNEGTTIAARIADGEGVRSLAGRGNGPIDAFVASLRDGLGVEITVRDYHEHARTTGANAAAVAYVALQVGAHQVVGIASDANIVTASLRAIVNGLNRASRHVTFDRDAVAV
jgi:2-isopropylmalate synthase